MTLFKEFKDINIYKYLFLFLFCIVVNCVFIYTFYDGIAQYGMSRAIRLGEIPYNDFNMVSTPLFFFIHALFLFIYDSYLTFTIVNSLIFVLIYYYCSKICPKFAFTIILLLCLPLCYIISPSYNLLAKLFILILIYFEKEKKNDFSIGLLLGLLLLTKHSVGICIMLCSFLYIRDFKKIFSRIKGMIIPLLIFLIYLLITHSFYNFFDLTFLGLFDFGSKNMKYSIIVIIVFFALLIYYLYDILNNKKHNNYLSYYSLGSLSFLIIIFDLNHLVCALLFFFLVIFTKYNIKFNYFFLNIFLTVFLSVFIFLSFNTLNAKFYSFNHYPLLISSEEDYKKTNDVLHYYKEEYPNSIMISPYSALYDTIADKKITYFDLSLRGNYGHLGTKKMINKLEHNKYYFIYDKYKKKDVDQFDIELCEYVINHSKFIESVGAYKIYRYDGIEHQH